MRAATIVPGEPDEAELREVPEPEPAAGELRVEGLLVGVCGTDREVTQRAHGELPPGQDRMVLFHEGVGRVVTAPEGSGFAAGDHVVGIVRRPDPEPCPACAQGLWDFCSNGGYTERGIKQLDGFGSERWTVPAEYAVPVGDALGELAVLTEPTSVVAKAWQQAELIGARAHYDPKTALVTGAGPIGLLAALLGAQQGLDVHVLDKVTSGPKPDLVRDLGATYHSDMAEALEAQPDVVIEATGSGEVVFGVLRGTARNAITVLTGLSSRKRTIDVPANAINDELVLDNDVLVGSVNANRGHYERAVRALQAADPAWLARLISRRVPLSRWTEVFEPREDDVKVVVDLHR
jgi:threonine dehydrogenase-like Zn-dependent dehydrogenase